MLPYIIKTKIDGKGNLNLSELPFQEGQEVLISITSIEQKMSDLSIEDRIERVRKTFGTIKSHNEISNEMLSRENLYDDEGR